jgi:hypothetical protein
MLKLGDIVKLVGSDEVQLRAPFFLAASVGALGWSVAWLVRECEHCASILMADGMGWGDSGQLVLFQFSVSVFRFRRTHQADSLVPKKSEQVEKRRWRHRHIPIISGNTH